jgi:hypothetical protein
MRIKIILTTNNSIKIIGSLERKLSLFFISTKLFILLLNSTMYFFINLRALISLDSPTAISTDFCKFL